MAFLPSALLCIRIERAMPSQQTSRGYAFPAAIRRQDTPKWREAPVFPPKEIYATAAATSANVLVFSPSPFDGEGAGGEVLISRISRRTSSANTRCSRATG